MKTLIVEDDFINRKIMQKMLLPYGECDIAVNGKEALDAFKGAFLAGQKYELICLDIMMPELDGQAVLREIRKMESQNGVAGLDCVKIVMTTALGDPKNIMKAFNEQCDAYLVKPIDKQKITDTLRSLGLIEAKA